jgi:hypothetical protein
MCCAREFLLICVLILCARNICASFLVPCLYILYVLILRMLIMVAFEKKKKHSWEFGSLGFCSYISSVALSRDRNRLLFVV